MINPVKSKNVFIKSWSVQTYNDLEKAEGQIKKNIRRLNYPVQASLLSAYKLVSKIQLKESAGLFSVAPCNNGSLEIFNWAGLISQNIQSGAKKSFTINPVHTLHAVDNLALSMLSILFANKEYCIGFGGAAGQFWVALDKAVFMLLEGMFTEVLIFAGDIKDINQPDSTMGAALLLSTEYRADLKESCHQIRKISHSRYDAFRHPVKNSVEPMVRFIDALKNTKSSFEYIVPQAISDGQNLFTIDVDGYE